MQGTRKKETLEVLPAKSPSWSFTGLLLGTKQVFIKHGDVHSEQPDLAESELSKGHEGVGALLMPHALHRSASDSSSVTDPRRLWQASR